MAYLPIFVGIKLGVYSHFTLQNSDWNILFTMDQQRNNPLHGKTLQTILEYLLDAYGWDGLARQIDINCFKNEPSINSSLKFLRKTPWARQKVEDLYLRIMGS